MNIPATAARFVVLVGALVLAPAGRILGQGAPGTAELPLSRAVLLSSGVGYFEHAGQVEGDGLIRLNFKTAEINDVLKSMVLMDEGGGSLSTVTYPSNDPIERSLRSFGVDISKDPSLPDLLRQLRGAAVTVMAPDKISGSILTVETSTIIVGNPPTEITEHTLQLVTASGVRSIPMRSIGSLELADAKLREELNKALGLLIASRDTDRRPVDIRFEGAGQRYVRVGYLVESPVWKTSYRLDLSGTKPLLQGWAIVENTSDEDWKQVRLTLVSGRPISFVQDLYTPFYMPRPVVVPERYASLTPRRYEEGMEQDGDMMALRQQTRGPGGVAGLDTLRAKAPAAPAESLGRRRMTTAMELGAADEISLAQGVQSMSEAAKLGELFQFTIQQPVDLPRRRSAMLPIVNEAVTAEKVSIYNQSVLANHPLNGAWLTNSTSLKLPDGPITVFDGGSYAGDAQIDHLAPNDKRLISYAVDLSVTVDPSVKSANRIVAGKIVKGVLQITRLNTFEQTYAIKNKADDKRTMIIEHPFFNGRELVEPKQAEEKTPQLYRFRVPIEAGKTGEFKVAEEQKVSEAIALLDQPVNTLAWYVSSGQISEPIKQALSRAMAIKNELSDLQARESTLTNELNSIKQGQERLRQNLASVGQDSALGKRYLAKLNEEEDRIEQLEAQLAETRKAVEAKRHELAAYLNALNLG